MALSSIMTGALLSANTSRQIAHVQHATKRQMDGHAGVLDAEIKLDSARGGDVTKKKEELEETQKKAAELVEQESIVRRARVESDELKENARQEAANLHKNTLDYIDSLLAETDRKMSELINNIRLERNEIRNHR